MKWIAGSVVLVALLAAGAAGQRADFEARRAEAWGLLRKDIEGYVEWCHSKTLFQEKARALGLLLEFEPGHEQARKALGYVRDKSGQWQAPAKPRVFKDFDKKALAEAPERWRAVGAGFVTAMSELVEAAELSPAQRELAAREALRFDPDNERIHTRLGEVKGEKGWVLPETLRAKEGRELLRSQVRSAFQRAEGAAEPAPLTEREKRFALAFTAVAAPGLRVVGTTGEEELHLAAQAVLGLQYFVQAVFESKYTLPRDCTVFLLSDPAQLPAFLAAHPAIPAAERALYERLEGSGITGTNDFAFWTGDTQRRIDGIVRLVLGFWLSGAFEINVKHGWAYEGLGLYLTRSLVRSRLTWLAQPSTVLDAQQDLALRQKLIDPATNWMDEALRLVQEKRQPPLPELFQKNATLLTTEDVLTAYTLASYLLEVHPEVVPKLLARLGTGYSASQGLQEALRMDLATFQPHLARWLSERN